MMKEWMVKGQRVRPADGSKGLYEIVDISEGNVSYQDVETGQIWSKCVFGFFCRYTPTEAPR